MRGQVEAVVSGVVTFVALSFALAGCGEHPRPSGDGIAVTRVALFTNGDFEADAINAVPSGWTVQHYLNPGITDTVSVPPNATSVPQTLPSLNLTGTGSEANGTNGILGTLIVGATTPESVVDPDPLMAGASLRYPKYGTRAVRVNYNNLPGAVPPLTAGASNNVNALRQTMTVTNGDVDAADNKVHIRFTVAPVLQNPNHAYTQQPYYFVRLQNITKGTTLYSDFNTSAQPGVPWKIVGSLALGNAIYYTDWQLVDIGPGNAGLAVGDQVELLVIAAGCAAGGHWGRVYVDGIGSTIPGIYTAATGPASANSGANITYVVNYKNGGTGTAAATQLNMVIPTDTTYQSNSLPSACSGLSPGATGTLVCSLGALAPGASGSFTVTLNINSGVAAGSTITNGNYSIQATGVTALLGPKVLTTVTSGVTYADVSVTKTDGVAAVGWGQAVTYTVRASNAGPGAATTVTIADTMPAQLSGATWTCAGTSGGTCTTASGTGNLSGTIALPVGATATYTIQGNIIAGTGTGTVTNTATATLGGGAVDPDTTNNSAVDTDSIGVLRTLSITKTNSNGGSVITVPASINCGTSCSAATGSFVDGTSVVITASPVSGASFTAWGGACAGSASTCTLTMTGDQTVTAAFTPPPTVNITTGNNQGAAIGTAFVTQLRVRVLDSASNPVVGQTVLFTVPTSGASATLSSSSVTTDASGFASTTATANGIAGAYSVVAALSGTPTTGTFSLWNYGAATAISVVAGGSPQSATVGTAFTAPLTVIVRDAAGQPVPGVVVAFAAPATGARATLTAATATTTSSGQASVNATAGQTSGSFSVTASVTGIPPVTFALTNTAGAAASITATSGGGQTAVLGAMFTLPLTVTVRDAFSNLVTGAAVTFTAPTSGASASLGTASGTTNSSGQFSTTAIATGAVGLYAVGAAVAGVVTQVSFSLGNFGTLALAPATVTVAPRASATFSATGDPTASYVYVLQTNNSVGSVNGGTGVYTAGPTGGVADVVRVTDSLGRTATATVTVGSGVSLSPSPTSVSPRGTRTFTAVGGSGTGFAYALTTNNSAGSINGTSGVYVAGATGGVTDVVTVTDSLGNTSTATVTVGSGVSLSPSPTSVSPRGTRTFTAVGGSGTGFAYVLTTNNSVGSINGTSGVYVAGPTGGVTDVVTVTDSLGNTSTATVTVGSGVSISPGTTSVSPRGTRTFSASGGSGTGFAYALTTNNSAGSINGTSGVYVAGPTGGVTDVVRVTDSLGNTATATVTVGSGVTISPSLTSISPLGTRTFSAAGGSGTGFTYALSTNASSGSINGTSGVYVAGVTGGVTDVVRVTDSLGNTATATVTVGSGVTISPSLTSVSPRDTRTFTAAGGSGTGYTYALSTNASGGTIDNSTGVYVAGASGGVTDIVTATDSLGSSATASISVSPGVNLSPASASTTPRGTINFTATDGSGITYVYTVSTNHSGATIDAAGKYIAGDTGSVGDVVSVSDSLGNTASSSITVGPGVTVTPSVTSAPPRGARTFTAAGGSGTGYTYTLSTNASGGSINATTGAYTAGPTGSVNDGITVTDSLGNSGTASVSVNSGINLSPLAPSTPPQGTIAFAATDGSGAGYTYSVTTNRSGATIDASGRFVAGTTGDVTDVVTVTDSLGNTATSSVVVRSSVTLIASGLGSPPRGSLAFSATGGSGAGFIFTLGSNASGGTIDAATGAYTAGTADSVTDTVVVTDALGNVAAANVAVGVGVSITPASPATPPQGQVSLVASGGSGTGFTFAVVTNSSGGSVDGTTGLYTGGAVGSTVDVVRATDSLGNVATVAISVGNGLSINPATPSLAPRQSQLFSAIGGSGTGFTFALSTNSSGGRIDTATGAYVAGSTGNTGDVVTVTDSIGNIARAMIQVGPGLVVTPTALSLAPLGTRTFSVSGGSGINYRFALSPSNSGGTIDPTTGAYESGSIGGVVDVVQVADSLGNTSSVSVTVTSALEAGSTLTLPPRGSATLTVTGGAGGNTFALTTNGSGATLDPLTGAYVAGNTGGTSDLITVTDANGATVTIRVIIGEGLSLVPASPSASPRGQLRFTASGGSGSGYTYTIASNLSGGSIDANTGAYEAGSTSNVVDVVEAVDSLGNARSVSISIGGSLAVNPATPEVAPQATVSFVVAGGSGSGIVFTLTDNMSGGSVDPASGVYRAGSTPNVSDQLTVTDSRGNSVTATILVGAGVLIAPVSSRVAPGGAVVLSASGGSGTGYVFALTANNSGGGVDIGTGIYIAGTVPNVVDTVTVSDSLGNSATATIEVGAGVSLTAVSMETPPLGSLTLTASGGSGTYTFALRTNGSGASIVSTTGLYTAGPTPRTTDSVEATDMFGNSAAIQISVGDGVSITPASPVVVPGGSLTFAALGGSGTGYVFTLTTNGSGATIDPQSGGYVAGDSNGPDDPNDVVAVTDSLGNSSSASIAIGDHLSLNPPTSAAAPHAVVQFIASGGSATGYVFTIATNSSGATIDPDTGAYQAGALSSVTDVVKVVDSLGRSATAAVMVGSGLGITPTTMMIAPKDTIDFRVSGGSGAGHRFALTTNGSGGTVDATSGDYQAGEAGNTTDVVTVTDSLGNSAAATVTIGKSLSFGPAETALPPRGSARPTAMGGAVPYAFSVSTNRSGATVNASTGEYVAGSTPNVADTVTVTDANRVSRSVTINVGAGVSISPADPTVALGGTIQLTASGGSGTGFTWRVVDNSAGGTVDVTSGAYTASHTQAPGTPDVVEARDTLGNAARVTILQQVTTVKTVSASGGSGGCNIEGTRPHPGLSVLLFSLLALAIRRKKVRRA